MSIQIGINIISLAFLSPGINHLFATPGQLIKLAWEIGFDFIMALPLRGATGWEEPDDFIKFYEQAWNPGTIWGFLTRQCGKEGPPRPHDILLFPSPAKCAEITLTWGMRAIREIGHDFSTRLVEIAPRLDMGPRTILYKCRETGCQLVIDTSHLQRGYREDEILLDPDREGRRSPLGQTLDQWLAAIELWQPHLANVMHLDVNPFLFLDDRLGLTIKIFRCWLECTRHFEDRYIVLEYQPELLPARNRALAEAMLKKTRQLVGA